MEKEKSKTKVIIGLSGGVDSAVGLINLKEQGYDVEAVFMRNWDSTTNNDFLGNPTVNDDVCPQEKDYQDALAVANKLGIKLHRIDFIEEYWNYVFSYFLNEYKHFRTPNPDVLCNKEIKFKAFLKYAETLGADYIAMGHYARVSHGDKHLLLRGLDSNRDQTYFLCGLTKEQLSRSLFPIGEVQKPDVRKKALEYGLDVATKKDSTGVCFIGERNFKEFLKNYLPANPGDIEDTSGNVVGRHEGIMYYTIGQRKGLAIGGPGEAWFVCGKDTARNVLVVAQGDKQELLYGNRVIVKEMNFINGLPDLSKTYQAKFRYRQADNDVTMKVIDSSTIEVNCLNPVKAITPGQFCVIYDGEVCLGGGIIDEVFMNDIKRRY